MLCLAPTRTPTPLALRTLEEDLSATPESPTTSAAQRQRYDKKSSQTKANRKRLDLYPGKMSRPPNHVPWATAVDVDEMTVHGDFMPPFPSPDDARFLEPPVTEWVPDPAFAAKASPTYSVTPAASLGYTPKSPPGPPPDTIHRSYSFDLQGMRSPTHSPDEEDPGGGGGLIVDREVLPPSFSAEAAASNNSEKPSSPSPTGGATVSLATEFVMCNDLLEEGEIPEDLVSFLVCRYVSLKKKSFRTPWGRFSISISEAWSKIFNERLKGYRARYCCCASLVARALRIGIPYARSQRISSTGRSHRLADALLLRFKVAVVSRGSFELDTF